MVGYRALPGYESYKVQFPLSSFGWGPKPMSSLFRMNITNMDLKIKVGYVRV